MKGMKMGIEHIVDLETNAMNLLIDDILNHAERYEWSEKIDGTLNASMWINRDGALRLTRPTKKQFKHFSEDDLPKVYKFNSHRFAIGAFKSMAEKLDLAGFLTQENLADLTVEFEVLHGSRPNTIKYNHQCIIPLRIIDLTMAGTGSVAEGKIDPKVMEPMFESFIQHLRMHLGSSFTGSLEARYKSYFCKVQPDSDMPIVVSEDLIAEPFDLEFKEIYETLDMMSHFRLQKVKNDLTKGCAMGKTTEHFSQKVLEVKSIVGKDRSVTVEGVVIRNIQDGKMWKIVNKDHFTKANQFIWSVRSRFQGGRKVGDEWIKGIHERYLEELAEMFGIPVYKTPMMKKYINDAVYESSPDKADEILKKALGTAVSLDDLKACVKKYFKEVDDTGYKYAKKQGDSNLYDDEVHERTSQAIMYMILAFSVLTETVEKGTEENYKEMVMELLVYSLFI
jgi:hypothetical protein